MSGQKYRRPHKLQNKTSYFTIFIQHQKLVRQLKETTICKTRTFYIWLSFVLS